MDLDRLSLLIVYCGYVTGDVSDMDRLKDEETVLSESLMVAGSWIVLTVGLSCLWFSYKDY